MSRSCCGICQLAILNPLVISVSKTMVWACYSICTDVERQIQVHQVLTSGCFLSTSLIERGRTPTSQTGSQSSQLHRSPPRPPRERQWQQPLKLKKLVSTCIAQLPLILRFQFSFGYIMGYDSSRLNPAFIEDVILPRCPLCMRFLIFSYCGRNLQ